MRCLFCKNMLKKHPDNYKSLHNYYVCYNCNIEVIDHTVYLFINILNIKHPVVSYFFNKNMFEIWDTLNRKFVKLTPLNNELTLNIFIKKVNNYLLLS